MNRFDPIILTPNASLNRVRFLEPSVLPIADGLAGRTAYDVLSTEALLADLRARSDQLRLDPSDPLLPRRFGMCFGHADPAVRDAALDLATRWGRRLASLVMVLVHGEPAYRAVRPEWDDSYWQHWGTVRQVWLGGGLVSGGFGHAMLPTARAFLAHGRHQAIQLGLAPHAAYLPLIGAARSARRDRAATLVFDFGGTAVKRAIPSFEGDVLAGLRILPPVPAIPTSMGDPSDNQGAAARSFVLETMLATIRETSMLGSTLDVVASISAYVAGNRVLPGQGGRFGRMTEGVDDISAWIAERIERDTGIVSSIDFVHDGTAAARTFAGQSHAAIIMMGTAVGSGFPPAADAVRAIAPTFGVRHHDTS